MTIEINYNGKLMSNALIISLGIVLNVGVIFGIWNFLTSGYITGDYPCGSSFGFIDMITQKQNCQFAHTMVHPILQLVFGSMPGVLFDVTVFDALNTKHSWFRLHDTTKKQLDLEEE